MSEGVDDPQVYIRHLLICEGVHHDPFRPGRSYSLERIVNWMRPEDEFGFPFVVEQLVLFAQAWGDKGDYEIRIDLFELNGNDESERLIHTERNRNLTIYGNEFVETKYWLLHQISFPNPGVFEVRLMRKNHSEPIASERIQVLEV